MFCKFCGEYCGFNEDINCGNKHCMKLSKHIEKLTVKKIVEIIENVKNVNLKNDISNKKIDLNTKV